MDSCLTCGGLIPEPGIAYGYAGPTCRCQVLPRIQRRASAALMGNMSHIFQADPALAADEWWVVFNDHKDLSHGTISKYPWRGGSNMTATFKVKKV